MRRALTIIDVLVSLAILALLLATLAPSLVRLRSGSAEATSIANLQTLSFAHAMYAWDWEDRQVTWIPDDAGFYTVQSGLTNWFFAYPDCPSPMILGWEDDASGILWGYFLPCDSFPGSSANSNVLAPFTFTGGNAGFGSFRLANAQAFHAYVDGRFYSETFYTPTDTRTWELASAGFDFDGSFTIPPPLGQGGLPSIVNSSYCLSPAAMLGPEVLSYDVNADLWYKAPWTSTTGYTSPTVSQCAYPDLKTRMIEHNWNVGQPAAVNPAFSGNNTPYFFNHGLAAAPVTLYFDGHVDIVSNSQVVADDAAVLAGTGGAVGLWTRDTPLGASGYFGAQSFDGTLVSHHILTADGILGRDVLNTMASQGLDGSGHPSQGQHRTRAPQSTSAAMKPLVRPPGSAPTGVPW